MNPEGSNNNKGKAVVVKEEPSSLPMLVDAASPAVPPPLPAAPMANIPGPHQYGENRSLFIKHVIMYCVAALDMGNVMTASAALQSISSVASPLGDHLKRVAFTFAEAFARRAMRLLPGLTWAMQLQVPPLPMTPEAINAARRSFAALCPLVRVAATAVNHAILGAMAAERAVHVVDLGGANPNQWLELIRLFAARSRSPPSLRLSVVNEEDDFLSSTAGLLTQEAVRLGVNFLFNPVRSNIDHFTPTDVSALRIVEGREALVITSTLQLHRLIADEVTINLPGVAENNMITKADALLRVLRDQKPKLVVLTEQEAHHNDETLKCRVKNAFDYYAALFHDLETGAGGLASGVADRVAVERVLLRNEVMDIVAGDGVLRRERHEKITRWLTRMTVAGFEPIPMTYGVIKETAIAAHLLSGSGSNMRIYRAQKVNTGCIFLYARKIPIFSVSVWCPVMSGTECALTGI